MAMKITHERLKIINALQDGPQSWTTLRVAYYGEERAKSPASTSFYNQLQRMMDGGLIKKVMGGYALVEEEHPCPRCNTMIGVKSEYCVGCTEDLKAAGRKGGI